jgi:ATP-dependent DNA helicase 2 subunit 2
MPFADDVRKYTFASLDRLVNKKGEVVSEHPYLPTEKQLEAMDDFVDAMDLMSADRNEEGYVIKYNSLTHFVMLIHRLLAIGCLGLILYKFIIRLCIASNRLCFIVPS